MTNIHLTSRSIILTALLAPAVSLSAGDGAGAVTGPSSSQSPYLLRSRPGVVSVSILTTGDSVNYKSDGITPYRLAGIPDGLGAFDNLDGTFTLLVNHELSSGGLVHDHGFNGAFISRWTISKDTLQVLHGEDLIKHAWSWVGGAYVPQTTAFSRFCSADLAESSAFYNPVTGRGYNGRIFLTGEESGANGRAYAHFLDGNSYELPWLGKMSFENVVANPQTGDTTVVAGLDDSGGGQVYFCYGAKTTSPNPVAAAGLVDGVLYGLKVTGFAAESASTGIPSGTPFTLAPLGDVSAKTGAQIEAASVSAQVTAFRRPEDGAWDPNNPNHFYFVTTDSFDGRSRLWRLNFIDAANPALGGTIDMLLNGTEGQKMMDNMTITRRGSIFIQEDVGNNAQLGKIWRYSIARNQLESVASHDASRFLAGGSRYLNTQDEESSGIIPANEILGEGWYLLDVQAHYPNGPELVEGGQILALHFPPGQEK